MKKLISLLVSAAFVAMPLATLSTPVAARPLIQAQAEKKAAGDKVKGEKMTKKAGKKAGKKKMAKKAA